MKAKGSNQMAERWPVGDCPVRRPHDRRTGGPPGAAMPPPAAPRRRFLAKITTTSVPPIVGAHGHGLFR